MRCTKLLEVFILYLLSFEGRFLSKIEPFITVLLIKKLPLKKLSIKGLLLIAPSMKQLSEQSISTALCYQRLAGDAA